MADPITVDQFAASIKAKYPQYAQIPDAQLVEKVVAKYPQYKSSLGGASLKPPSVEESPASFPSRVLDRVNANMEGAAQFPGEALRGARSEFLQSHPENASQSWIERLKSLPSTALDAAGSSLSAAAKPPVTALASLTPPGIADRMMRKEDPAALAGDALMMLTPGTEELGKGTHTVTDPTKAGYMFGTQTRGAAMLDHVDAAAEASGVSVNWQPMYKWAKKIEDLSKQGFPLPKPVSDYIAWVDGHLKPGTEKVQGGVIDRGGQLNPLPYRVARNFEQSLGEEIPWDSDRTGKVNGLMKKMREAGGNEIASALKPHGLDIPYLRGKAEFEKYYKSGKIARKVGKLGGKMAGYGVGSAVGFHPWMVRTAGGELGKMGAGSMVDSMAKAGSRTPRATTPTPEAMSPEAAIRQWRANMPPKSAAKPGMNPMETSAWQQSLFKEKPTPDYGAQARQANPEPTRAETKGKSTATRGAEAFKQGQQHGRGILDRVISEHPEWPLHKQLTEAAKRAQETGQ